LLGGLLLLLSAVLLLRRNQNPGLAGQVQDLLERSPIGTRRIAVLGLVDAALHQATAHPLTTALVSAAYGLLERAEGIGLLLHRRWAEYLTALVTTSFVPVGVAGLLRHLTPLHLLILVFNIAAVIYLVRSRHLWPIRLPK
jgi:uncharacterized membrane protein (DUF2068 family)